MKFQVNRDVFSEAVSFAVKLLPQRTTLPILSGVLIEATDEGLTLSSFDYEVSARTQIIAEVEEPGRVLVSGKLLADIASRLPNAPVRFSTEDNKITVACGTGHFTLSSMPVEEYPSLPQISDKVGTLKADLFAAAISQVAVAASRDDVTPVITGVQLEVSENNISLVATDRYRVAVRDIEWDAGASGVEAATALVPAKTLVEVGKTFGNSGEISVAITSSDERELIAFQADRKTVTSLLIKGNFPPVRRLFPETVDNFAVMNTGELIEAVRRVSLVLEREAALRFTFTTEGVTLEAIGSEQAQASETIDAFLTGDDTVVSLKPQFLIDGLSSVHSEFVRISFTKTENPNKPGPVLITSQSSKDQPGSDNYKYLLQPNLLLR
ncbi:DNA polymerase III subunit beta [Salinibacterium sp. NSLL150]|uniref:DNA polymerase III subunit beta n=1 Tax=unclassified Salinibacterium TaxID=2632331 RepID=UPI0018CCD645|nr:MULTISPECIES: DNA polymerase III subunit beta [unclassified Salinibacterium]MBH0022746.1 DNA polymerase III subunit beta [Salinibacterium sp. SWN248]MBH0097743.1 DNA polymerase III subunit beta [Salinibacterium sp. NSLL35]MBH0100498.1 DNA polymerase III subunit beta [Salinibacterium sp. NSLL150]MBH0103257.1 DNA polymerase III subunit beta [Salinibacterium sp. NSLL16]MBH0106018.1 DNA polymerase III subunit beta [Salinibacterium sp. NSLL17]